MSVEAELKDKCKEMALVAVAEAIESSWDKFWQARNRAAKEDKADYPVNLSVKIKSKGDGKANVGCDASWSESHKAKIADKPVNVGEPDLPGMDGKTEEEELCEKAYEIFLASGRASTAMLQRRLSLSLTVAGQIMDKMEKDGMIGPPAGEHGREVFTRGEVTEPTEEEPTEDEPQAGEEEAS